MSDEKKMTFEEAMEQLESIVRQLEDGELSLDASMEAFEEAVRLSRLCSRVLEGAKQRVKVLTVSEDGSVSDRPFDGAHET